MKLPVTFNSLLWLANARCRLAYWLAAQRRAVRNYAARNDPMPAEIADNFSASIAYWRGQIKTARSWFEDSLEGYTSRFGFGPSLT